MVMPASTEELFLSTRQEPLKLKLALEGFFATESAEWKERYGAYLKKRLRPALAALTRANDIEKLETLVNLGWLDSAALDAAIRIASDEKTTEVLIYLLTVKDERFGFHDRTYEL